MSRVLAAMIVGLGSCVARADVLFHQPPETPAGLAMSSWWEPDDSDYDNYSWDSFILPAGGNIQEVKWRGGYSMGNAPITGFVVGFWPSIGGGSEPDMTAQPVEYSVRTKCGETYVGTFNGIPMYEYDLVLSHDFVAEPGVKYWIQIEASENGIPGWGVAWGTGGNGAHFQYVRGAHMFFMYGHDESFTLIGTSPCTGAAVSQDPLGTGTCATGSASFQTVASGSGLIGYQWERETSPGSGVYAALADGPTGSWDGGAPGVGAIVSGSDTATLSISADTINGLRLSPAHAIRYRCTVSNGCGSASSAGAQLTVCFADFNCDGGVNTLDVLAFLNAWSSQSAGGDFNHDGVVNTLDVLAFLNSWNAGC